MEHYSRENLYEREPLDSPDARYGTPPQFDSYRPDPGYYDTSPRHEGNPLSLTSEGDNVGYDPRSDYMAGQGPVPPRHGDSAYYSRGGGTHRSHDTGHARPLLSNTITPGADNFSESASGGMAGIARSVAEHNARESGMEALRSTGQVPPPPSRTHNPSAFHRAYSPHSSGRYGLDHSNGYGQGALDQDSHTSLTPLSAAAATPRSISPSRGPHGDPYLDDPYQGYLSTPRNGDLRLGMVDPNDIEDDGDDGLNYSKHSQRNSQRNSMLSASNSDRGPRPAVGATTAMGGAAAAIGPMGGLLGRHGHHGATADYDLSTGREKSSDWLSKQKTSSKRWKWAVIVLIFLVIVGAIVGGVVGGLIAGSKDGGQDGKNKGQSAKDDTKQNGDLDINSDEIQALLNNPDLHKVFPGMDYTPINTQYPDCMHNPPSQNNVTRDVAVLSQLTNKIRLYGTDCNQTQMVVHAVKQLKMTDTIKIWMGVWQNDNETTNARQLAQMWGILDDFGQGPFEGIIVANEILFREEMTIASLGKILDGVRTNLSDKNFDLPVATSDLGDDWTAALAEDSDYLMANIHPFFSGTPASEAAQWTSNFWQNSDGKFFKSNSSRNIISETGWPTSGGTNCGEGTSPCARGAVAGVDELNQFMGDWVCSALKNGTNYFWFEAFDEPWKVQFNEPGKAWEDQWGLMDVNRNLKKGVKIPDCDGQTV